MSSELSAFNVDDNSRNPSTIDNTNQKANFIFFYYFFAQITEPESTR